MTEEERVEQINKNAADFLQAWLIKLETGEVTETELLSSLYASMVAAYLYGYSPEIMTVDAKAAAARLLAMVENEEESDVSE
jgi:hypothetical protein